MATSWTQNTKPTTTWSTSPVMAKVMYDNQSIMYDDPNTQYDGINLSFNQITKPSGTSWTQVPKAT